MRVAYDSEGYSYDVDTGYYVSLCYDGDGNAYSCETGEPVSEVAGYGGGTSYSGFNWDTFANHALDAFGGGSRGYYPQGSYPGSNAGINASGQINRSGVSTGFNVSTNTLMLIAGGVLIFLVAKGRR